MKTIPITAKMLLLIAFIATAQSIFAQDLKTEDKQEFRIKVERDINGKKEKIDRTFTSREEMAAFIKENNIDMPPMPDEPGAANIKVCNKHIEKQCDKKTKKITVIEKEEGSIPGKTQLEISSNGLSSQERASIIQSLMNIKGSKVEIKQEQTIETKVKKDMAKNGKTISVTEKTSNADGSAQLEITSGDLSPEERATIIQSLMNIKDGKVEIMQERTNDIKAEKETAKTEPPVSLQVTPAGKEVIAGLQLYPNPNNGQFHISFNTGKLSDVTLRMLDISGRQVYYDVIKDQNGAFNKDIYIRPALSEGTYVLEAEANGQKITTQVVVQ